MGSGESLAGWRKKRAGLLQGRSDEVSAYSMKNSRGKLDIEQKYANLVVFENGSQIKGSLD